MFPLVAHVVGLSLSLVAGPCDLVDKAAASALLGEAVAAVDVSDPEEDEDTGGMISHCSYRGKSGMLVVSEVSFKTAAAARQAITKEAVSARLEGEVTELVEDSGLGDKAWWAYNQRGAQYMVLKGAHAVSLSIGGTPGQALESMRAKLRAAAASAASKLP